MAKVKYPLFSGDVHGDFGKMFIVRKGGVVSKYFVPRDPKSAKQLEIRGRFLERYVAGLTKAQADLLYAAIVHLHDELYSPIDHGHDHGGLAGLGDDDHSQYFNQARGDARYLQSVPQQDHGGLAGLGDDDHSQYHNNARGDARYVQIPGAPTWTAPTLLNSWVNSGSPYANAGYYKDALGTVHLRGVVQDGAQNTVIFTLPAGYRPPTTQIRVTISAGALSRIDIYTDGSVYVVAGSGAWLSLDGLIFDL